MIITNEYKDEVFQAFYGLRPYIGESVSGDEVVFSRQADYILVGIIDGLGHGKKAATVAQNMRDYFHDNHHLTVDTLLSQAHEAFKGSQGAVVALAKIHNNGQAEYIGLGNIEARVINSTRNMILLSRDGALGIRSRKIEAISWQMENNEILVLYSDGLSSQMLKTNTHGLPFIRSTNDIYKTIDTFGKAHDDVSLVYLHKLTPP